MNQSRRCDSLRALLRRQTEEQGLRSVGRPQTSHGLGGIGGGGAASASTTTTA